MSEQNVNTDVTDDTKPIDLESVENEVSTSNEARVSEEKPIKRGYMSYEEWKSEGRDPEEFKGRRAYEKEGEVYEALIRNQREVKRLKDDMTTIVEANKRIEALSYERAKAELKSAALEATSIGDVKRVDEITDKLVKLEQDKFEASTPRASQSQEVNPDVLFSEMNPWYSNPQSEEDYQKVGFAIQASKTLKQSRPDLSIEEHLNVLNLRIKDRFEGKTMVQQPVVSGTSESHGQVSEAKKLMDKLPEHHKDIVRALKRADKNFSLQSLRDYVKRAERLGDI